MISNRAGSPPCTEAAPPAIAGSAAAPGSVAASRKPALRKRVQKPKTDDADGRRLTLKDMMRGASTTARAVRFYESQKLIAAAERSRGGHRLFHEDELGKLRLVLDLRTCGFSIEEIREILRAKSRFADVRESAQAIQRMLSEHVAELQRKIQVIERLGREFHSTIDVLSRCARCTDPRGPAACQSCDLPATITVPESFCHIWSVPRGKPHPGSSG